MILMGASIGRNLLTPVQIQISVSPYVKAIQKVSQTLTKPSETPKALNHLLALEMNQETKRIANMSKFPTFIAVKKSMKKVADLKREPGESKLSFSTPLLTASSIELDDSEFIESMEFIPTEMTPVIVMSDIAFELPTERIAEAPIEPNQEDEIQTILSSTAKKEPVSIQDNIFTTADLPPLSDSVKLALNREYERPPIDPIAMSTQNFSANPTLEGIKAFMEADQEKRKVVKITGIHSMIDQGFDQSVEGMDLVLEYDKSEVLNSNEEGEIHLDTNLNSKSGLLRATILSKGYMRTKLDIHMNAGQEDLINVPLLDEYSFYKFMEKENVSTVGGHLLLEMDQSVKDADLDEAYSAKIYLDKDFKVVDGAPAPFILFVGVRPGNVLLTVDMGKSVADKIIQVSEEELLYTEVEIAKGKKMEFSLSEMNLLGRVNSQLSVMANDLRVFNSKIFSEKIGVNEYSIRTPDKILGFRDYFELTHLRESIFFGSNRSSEIALPSRGLYTELLNYLQISELGGACLIQINLKDVPQDFLIAGDKGMERLNYQLLFVDEDGEVGSEINPSTRHAYIYGEGLGIFNIKISYLDGQYDYMQTFCSPRTLLVEQL